MTHSLKYQIAAELLSALETEGYRLGVDKHLQIQSLLQKLPADSDAETLKLSLIPLLAQSPSEQERLYMVFENAVKRAVATKVGGVQNPADVQSPADVPFWKRLLTPSVLGLILLGLIVGGFLFWYFNQINQIPTEPNQPTVVNPNDTLQVIANQPITEGVPLSSTYFVENKSYPFPNHANDYDLENPHSLATLFADNWVWLRWLLAAALTASAVILWWIRARNRRKLVARQDRKDKPPYVWNIHIEGADAGILESENLEQISALLRRRSETDYQRLDMPRTIQATVERGGAPAFRFKTQTAPTDYLLLIDRQSVRNHRAQLFDKLYQAFRAQEVEIARYFYDSDLRVCYDEEHPYGIRLAEVQQRHYQARLLLVGTGQQLLSPLSGRPSPWAAVFEQWKHRALLTPKPLKSWGYDERQLATLFTTLPATLQGLSFWVDELDAGADARFDTWREKIHDAPNAPIIPDENDPLPLLHLYFEPPVLRWIAACAIYPALHWDLTLWLGNRLELEQILPPPQTVEAQNPPLVTYANLTQIFRLPWFVQGQMPESARTALLYWLQQHDADLLNRLRLALALELGKEENMPPSDASAFDQFRMNIAVQEWIGTENAERKKQLEAEIAQLLQNGASPDFTVLKYLNEPQSPLDFLVPTGWHKYVHPAGFRALGWLREKTDLLWLVPLWVLGIVALFWYKPESAACPADKIVSLTVADTVHRFCLNDPLSTLAYQELLIRAAMGNDQFEQVDSLLSLRSITDGSAAEYRQKPLIFNTLMSQAQFEDSTVQLLWQEIQTNLALDFYKAAKRTYGRNQKDSTCSLLDWAATFDSLDTEIKVAQLLCPKAQQTPQAILSIAPQILGQVVSSDRSTPLPIVQIRGAGVATQTNAKGNYTLRLPTDYPVPTITLSFSKQGYTPISQTFTIDKVRQLPTLSLNPIDKPTITDKNDTSSPSNRDASTVPTPISTTINLPSDKPTTNPVQTNDPNQKILAPLMVLVAGGAFQMGSNDKDGGSDEQPMHTVRLSAFRMGKYEITNAQFCQFLNEKGNLTEGGVEWLNLAGSYEKEKCRIQKQGSRYAVESGYENYPIIYVSWYGATAYAKWLSEKTGKTYRLPTEAEWEFAARGGISSKGYKYSGSNTVGDVAWYYDNSGSKTHPVGGKAANELGLHDMSGNVWEWCWDWYDEKYYEKSPQNDPKGAEKNLYRVLRGGAWYGYPGDVRAAYRGWDYPSVSSGDVGFRVVARYD